MDEKWQQNCSKDFRILSSRKSQQFTWEKCPEEHKVLNFVIALILLWICIQLSICQHCHPQVDKYSLDCIAKWLQAWKSMQPIYQSNWKQPTCHRTRWLVEFRHWNALTMNVLNIRPGDTSHLHEGYKFRKLTWRCTTLLKKSTSRSEFRRHWYSFKAGMVVKCNAISRSKATHSCSIKLCKTMLCIKYSSWLHDHIEPVDLLGSELNFIHHSRSLLLHW